MLLLSFTGRHLSSVDVLQYSAQTMARMVREKELSSDELMTAHIRRIEEVNERLNAVVEPLFDSAMEAARAADARLAEGLLDGPLHGVPFSVKDSIDIAGVRTTAGTLGRKDVPAAQEDATLVARLRAAGGIPIGKTNLPDLLFAYESDNLIFGRSNNPYDVERTPGGSSGGESALLAAGGSPLGLGSDAAGSVRLPAAFCGLAAMKPTSGRLPRTGHVPPAGGWIEALWQIGPMARSVEDLVLAMDLLALPDSRDYTSPPAALDRPPDLRGLRVAVFTDNGWAKPEAYVAETVMRAAGEFERAGLQVKEAIPPCAGAAYEMELALLGADGCAGLDAYVASLGGQSLHPILLDGFLARIRPRSIDVPGFGRLWDRWDDLRSQTAAFFESYDAVLCPVYTQTALLHGHSVHEDNFRGFSHTMTWNVTGNPAATICCGQHGGLPVNVQVVTGRWKDRLALALCDLLEGRLGGWQPPRL